MGGTIVLSEGIFSLTTTITMPSYVTLEGQGTGYYPFDGSNGGTVLKKAANISIVAVTNVKSFLGSTTGPTM